MNPDPASLERLHDIVTPPRVPWWPPAPGWYWVLGFLLVLALALALRWFIRWQHNKYRREALAELALQEPALRNPATRIPAFAALAELLKRTALTAFPRKQVATLTGPAWFQFLDHTGHTDGFSQGLGATLERAAYDPDSPVKPDEQELQRTVSLIRDWIKHH